MATFKAKIEFIDRREVTIEADSMKEAQAKYERGDWADETTYDFFSNQEIEPLTESEEE